jgi:hypothetical protein
VVAPESSTSASAAILKTERIGARWMFGVRSYRECRQDTRCECRLGASYRGWFGTRGLDMLPVELESITSK